MKSEKQCGTMRMKVFESEVCFLRFIWNYRAWYGYNTSFPNQRAINTQIKQYSCMGLGGGARTKQLSCSTYSSLRTRLNSYLYFLPMRIVGFGGKTNRWRSAVSKAGTSCLKTNQKPVCCSHSYNGNWNFQQNNAKLVFSTYHLNNLKERRTIEERHITGVCLHS